VTIKDEVTAKSIHQNLINSDSVHREYIPDCIRSFDSSNA